MAHHPLALHGVIYRADGTRVNVCIGEKDDDPVFCITDLLPHLGAKQSAKTLAEGITAEDLNVIIASLPIEDKDAEQRVKLNVLGMLNEPTASPSAISPAPRSRSCLPTRPATSVWTAL